MSIQYRKDINGLRGLAVLAVILNHLGVKLFSGGFIGVDLFFVISGYLITKIIAKDVEQNNFSFLKFYERRIRRILPALFFLLIAVIGACFVLYPPDKLTQFSKSLIATALFVSNINFWKESGYFDSSSQFKPLLHTWSLAVEEQFYIFFPLLLAGLLRHFKKFAPAILAGAALLSFGAGLHELTRDATAAFYLTPFRIWEFIFGTLLALQIPSVQIKRGVGTLIGLAGLAMTAAPIFLYSEHSPFPGWLALIPVSGAASLIFAGDQEATIVQKLLGNAPLAFIGKISYSLYLWHWPLIIFARQYAIRPLTGYETTITLLIISALSILSWRFIETPFRNSNFIKSKPVLIFAAGSTCFLLLAGFIFLQKEGFPERDQITMAMNKLAGNGRWEFEKCDVNYGDPTEATFCALGDKSSPPSFLVWGDSHAIALGKAIHISAAKAGVAGLLSYDPGCPSLLEMTAYPLRGNLPCPDYNNLMIRYLSEHPEIKTVILINRWTVWAEGTPYLQEEGPSAYRLVDANASNSKGAPPEELFALGIERTLQSLQKLNRNIILVAPIPEVGYDVSAASSVAWETKRDVNRLIAPTLDEYLTRNSQTFEIFNQLKKDYGVQVVEPWKILCNNSICRVAINGLPLYKDDDHLSVFGSEFVAPAFNATFQSISK